MSHHMDERNTPELDALLRLHRMATDTPSQLSDAFRLGYWAAQAEIASLQAEVGRLTAGLEFWMSDHDKRWVAQMERADKAEAKLIAAHNAAIEEAARELDAWGDIYGDNAAASIRALKRPT